MTATPPDQLGPAPDPATAPPRDEAMSDVVRELYGVRALVCAADGPTVRGDREAVDLIGSAVDADLVILPVARLDAGFFTLRTGIAGEVAGKFASYRFRLAIVGDIAAHLERSATLRAFVAESNRGRQLWFVDDIAELEPRLSRPTPTASR